MAITVDSSQWTGQRDDTPLAVPVVWGEFEDQAGKERALRWLRENGATEQETNPAPRVGGVAPPKVAVNEDQVPPPDENPDEAGRRNVRQTAVGLAMAGSAMAAAGIVIATGGAAAPAVAAAAATGAASGAVGTAIGRAADPGTEASDAPMPRLEGPVIGLQAPDADSREKAERLLREAGAKRVMLQETRSG